MAVFGKAQYIKRVEDDRLLTGTGSIKDEREPAAPVASTDTTEPREPEPPAGINPSLPQELQRRVCMDIKARSLQ